MSTKTKKTSPDLAAGRVAAITGAGSGIGRALAIVLARRGMKLALADRDEAGLRETLALVGSGTESFGDLFDVSFEASNVEFANKTLAAYGRVDFVANNAGVAIAGTVAELTAAEIAWLMGVNFWGVVHGTKAFLPTILAQKSGTILNVSSLFGIWAPPAQSAYAASKFAVRGFTESLRGELATMPGMRARVVTVHPGGIKTNIAKRARLAAAAPPDLTRRQQEAFDEGFLRISPESAAKTIVAGLDAGKERITIGAEVLLIDGLIRALGATGSDLVNKYFISKIPTE